MIYVVHSQAYIIGEDKKELSLLLKEITTFESSNPKSLNYSKKKLPKFWSNSLPVFFLIKK